MRILFMGTPEFAAISLRSLLNTNHEIVGVVTQPDRPKGRGLELQPSEVKLVALAQQLPLWQPEKVNTPEFIDLFRQLKPDVVVVVAFGQKIPAPVLFEPEFGCINVHGSLLPRYRGAAPIQWSILNGDATAGVTTMYMDEGWDTGDIIYQSATPVDPDENFASLYQRLAILGGELLVKTLADVAGKTAPRIPQNSSEATLAPKLKPELQLLNWNEPAERLHNIVRVLAPTPGAETYLGRERLKILKTALFETTPETALTPGSIIQIVKKQGIVVATGSQPLLISELQPAGKKTMAATDYANGRRLSLGMIFGTNV
ncbi:MAG TPA: methionyl-tRNA formyltransferase [Bacillota bacterium]|nr:methionyl-tRNA formyltransferase [Bacillota bacterium]